MTTFGGVKRKQHIIIYIILGMLTAAMPSICFARDALDSLVMNRVWNFQRNFTQSVDGVEQTVYIRSTFDSERRNLSLFLVPSMYSIARGERQFLGESISKLTFQDVGRYGVRRQIVSSTIPHNRAVMASQLQYITPSLYDVSLYPGHLLSPFHRFNRHYYRYSISRTNERMAVVTFRPVLRNTQLVRGRAVVDYSTGRLVFVSFSGEFDMLSFNVTATMSDDVQSLLPERCNTDATFSFLGNRIASNFTAIYNCNVSLPDSVSEISDRQLMEQLRAIPLKKSEQAIYKRYDEKYGIRTDTLGSDTTNTHKLKALEQQALDFIDDNLLSSFSANAGGASVHMSPLVNPQYVSYSPNKGISYKLSLGARYAWNSHRYLTLNPELGYSFKKRQIYYSAPLRMTYNPKRNGYAELSIAGGNRTVSSLLESDLQEHKGDSISLPEFRDDYIRAVNNVVAYDWLEITSGIVYHRRTSTDKHIMHQLESPAEYRSFAPVLIVRLTPLSLGPTLTANYERGIKNVFRSNLAYERWEFDAAYKKTLRALRQLNARVGSGFYTTRNSAYFVDYTNFRDENLPTGWNDEWAGQFLLLDSRWYNASNYYVRGHMSYQSPLMMLSWWPLIGRAVEKERVYISALSIQHTRPYWEVGYGFTNRFVSAGLFAGWFGSHFQKIGCKLTLELFKRW
ncbi:MAG: hypothetical protein IJ637_01825 [Prevotella sp.]|nr:hypothetical protein [Prevotella sp.]